LNLSGAQIEPRWFWELVALLFGCCVGSFLNVVALRALAEKSILWPPSHCPRCQHRLALLDNIPLLSWIFLRGKCRYCRGAISWQYPVVEASTGLLFWAIVHVYLDILRSPFNTDFWNHLLIPFLQSTQLRLLDLNAGQVVPDNLRPYLDPSLFVAPFDGGHYWPFVIAGALYLAGTLVAVTVTDLREKLIPHDITYPSMIIGILFSAFVRHDLLGAMVGIGASYILFDFIAFYGLKVYLSTHGGTAPQRQRRLKKKLRRRARRRLPRGLRWRLDLATVETAAQEEPMEVMGGGDAVLSAVMAAYLGWQLLSVSLILGFLIGTVMGMILLLSEMRKANLLHKCIRHMGFFALIGGILFGTLGYVISQSLGADGNFPMALPMALLGATGGALLGVVSVGTQVSKPYPFGPALAAGGLIGIFLLPNWLYLSAIVSSAH
jgi:leader peptidase (prepilin peptidase) / N-methyltransferase